jgi:hypothetical protein
VPKDAGDAERFGGRLGEDFPCVLHGRTLSGGSDRKRPHREVWQLKPPITGFSFHSCRGLRVLECGEARRSSHPPGL